MAKEWILNSAMNRYQLNFKRNVGATSEEIRKCSPASIEEWREYYYSNVRSEDHIADLGRKLYVKISEVLSAELNDITEDDCIDYMKQLVIDRTYDGYVREINTIYGQLEELLGLKILPATDVQDRLYNVDFYIEVNGKKIGLQIKPINNGIQIPELYKEQKIQKESHIKWQSEFGGKVFYIFSAKVEGKKIIKNNEVVDEIKSEIDRLRK
ncbi:MAG TPA: MjaI family restriction endonuclease [Spirochaetaceae bacterium]|nr:MjaI family restriction endonuclease [Spirochaetaceae bacterium]